MAALAVLIMAVSAGACRKAAPGKPARAVLRVGSAFAPLSTQLIEEYRRSLPDLDIRGLTATASNDVLRMIQANQLDFGVVLANDAYREYTARPDSAVRGVALLQPLPMYLVARAGSGIRSLADLKQRVVGVGARSTSTWTLATLVLKAFNVEPVIKELRTRDSAVAGLKNGSLDAIVLPGYVYPDEVTYSAIRDGAYLLPIDGPPVAQMRREFPFIRVVMIPRDIYPGQDRIVPTVGIDMVIVCRRGLDEHLVYELTEQLFNVFPRLAHIEVMLRFLNIDEAPATPIPLHPGAARYFRERELSR